VIAPLFDSFERAEFTYNSQDSVRELVVEFLLDWTFTSPPPAPAKKVVRVRNCLRARVFFPSRASPKDC